MNFGHTYLLIFYNYRFAKANHLSTLVTIKFTENKRLWNAGLRQLSLWNAGLRKLGLWNAGLRKLSLWNAGLRKLSLWNAGLRQLSLWKAGGLEKLEARPQDSVQILAIHQYG